VINAAASLHQPWRILECVCSEQTAKRRIEEQAGTGEHPAGNRDWRLYLRVKERFEAITLPKVVIDTGQAQGKSLERALDALR
jgi:adenylylsulfate kinase